MAALVEVAASADRRTSRRPTPPCTSSSSPRSRTIRGRLRGYEVVGMEDVGADLTFFSALDSREP